MSTCGTGCTRRCSFASVRTAAPTGWIAWSPSCGGSKHLLEETSNTRAVALLDEFLEKKGEKLVEEPLMRAVIQRDLWPVFNWLEGEHS